MFSSRALSDSHEVGGSVHRNLLKSTCLYVCRYLCSGTEGGALPIWGTSTGSGSELTSAQRAIACLGMAA